MNDEIKLLLQELIGLVFEVNAKTKHDLFLEFMGHIDAIAFSFYKKGWAKKKEMTKYITIYLDKDDSVANLKKLIGEVKKLC